MALRIGIFVVLTALALGIAWYLQRRRPDPPSAPSYKAPAQLDRDDFERPEVAVLVAVFSSSTCDTCPTVWQTVEGFLEADVVTMQIDVQERSDLHQRYKIDGVPTTVIADIDGVVVQAFFGFLRDVDVAESIARARDTAPD